MVVELPTFNGLTVDIRLSQFRKANPDEGMEFIDFDSPHGKELLRAFQKECSHRDVQYYHGALGYEAMVCERCDKHFS